jgi:hypothetical protein
MRPGEDRLSHSADATLRKHRVQGGIFQHRHEGCRELFHTFGHYSHAGAAFQHGSGSKLGRKRRSTTREPPIDTLRVDDITC